MHNSPLVNKLKEVNLRASETIKEVQKTNDPKVIEGAIYMLANDAWMMGVKDGRLDLAEDVARTVKELAENVK